MRKIKAWKSGWFAAAWFLALFFAGPAAAGRHDIDPVFFFVSDELGLSEETIEEICIDMREGEKSWVLLRLKPKAEERFNAYAADHVDGWLVLAAREKVIIKSKIMPGFELGPPLLMLSADSEELFELLRTSFGIDEPQICTFEN
jgi:hypothetical protein